MTKYIGPKTDGENVATQSDVGGSSLSDATPDALTPDQAGAAGTANAAARADHAHEILCAVAGAILPNDVAAEGTASSFARSDHTHSIATAAPGTITPDAAAAEGSSNSFARADHTHAIAASAPATNLTASTTNAEGDATSFARSNHTHAIDTAAPSSNLSATTTNAVGTSANLARSDHSHAITTGAAGTITGTNAEGTSASLARADHNHAIATAAAGTIVPDATAAAGSAASFSRSDHTHAINAAAPSSNLTASTTNAEGTSTSFARADHSHAISTGTPGSIQPDDSASAGTSADLARADHRHAIAAASAGTITGTNAEGTSTSFARADHNHAFGSKSVPASALALGPTYETSLPGSPVDGQEIYYAADAGNGVIWHLRYRSGASGSYKWEFLGGPPLVSEVTTGETRTSTTYGNLTTTGPSLTMTLAGEYDITVECKIGVSGATKLDAGRMSYSLGVSGNDSSIESATNAYFVTGGNESANIGRHHSRTRRRTITGTNTLATAKYASSIGNEITFNDRRMLIIPVRVG